MRMARRGGRTPPTPAPQPPRGPSWQNKHIRVPVRSLTRCRAADRGLNPVDKSYAIALLMDRMTNVLTQTSHKLAFFRRVVLLYYVRTCKSASCSFHVWGGKGQMRRTHNTCTVWRVGLFCGGGVLLGAHLSAPGVLAPLAQHTVAISL